jgi:hypothetical protein
VTDDESGVHPVEELWLQLGVPRDLLRDRDTLALLIPCAMEVFCDELKLPHPGTADDARLHALFGRQHFWEGSFRQALRGVLAESSLANRPGIEAFRTMVAGILANWTVAGGLMNHLLPSTNLVNDTLWFDGNQHSLELLPSSRPRIVVDYGPGIGERFILEEHFRAVAAGRPFFYLPVTQGPFVNHFAVVCLERIHGADIVDQYLARAFYLRQEDGMLAATTRLVASSVCGQCDVIFCSGLQLADRGEFEAGIVNAFTLLRPGGVLLIRASKDRDPPESSTAEDMLAMAYRAGFSEPLLFHATTTPRIGEHFRTLTAILTRR